MIEVASNFNIYPNIRSWRSLSQYEEVKFHDFNQWHIALNGVTNNKLVMILSIDNILESNTHANPGSLLVQQLENRITSCPNQELVLVFFKSSFNNFVEETYQSSEAYVSWINLEKDLNDLKEQNSNFYCYNLTFDLLKSDREGYSLRNWYSNRCVLSLNGLDLVINRLEIIIKRFKSSPCKAIILDCDNTLWGGVVGEDGIEGIKLGNDGVGEVFRDFQRELKRISSTGVLLCTCSKNNEEDVFQVLENHSSMILNKDSFILHKINWNEKARNIQELSSELGLGTDSFVFIDDNPIEREKVRKLLPDVTVPEMPKQIYKWVEYLKSIQFIYKFSVTAEDKRKKDQYKSRAEFVEDSKSSSNLISYLKNIELKPKLKELDSLNIERASQLTSKTNQFNIFKVPYSTSELKSINEKDDHFIRLIELEDVYDNYGIVGLIVLSVSKETLFINTFLMSCRVLGRYLEQWIIDRIVEIAKSNNCAEIRVLVDEIRKNKLVHNLFPDLGFTLVEKNDNVKTYSCLINDIELENIEIYEKQVS